MPHRIGQSILYGAGYFRLLLSHSADRAGRTLPRLEREAEEAVLIVPGFLAPRSLMLPLELRFERSGVPAFTIDFGLTTALPFSMVKERLVRAIDDVRFHNPLLTHLSIVAHSMGGVIAAEVIADGAIEGLRVTLVTLGSPFSGSWAALMGCPISFSAYEMLPIHPRYAPQNGSRKRVSVPFLSIAGQDDILVPAERCEHPDAVYHPMPVDHAGLLFRKSVFRVAKDFIATGKIQ